MTQVDHDIVASAIVSFVPPDYSNVPPPITYSGAEVEWSLLAKFIDEFSSQSVCTNRVPDAASLNLIASEVRSWAKKAGFHDVVVNDSRPTGDPMVWRRYPNHIYIHPVVSINGTNVRIAYSTPKNDVWVHAFVMLHPTLVNCES